MALRECAVNKGSQRRSRLTRGRRPFQLGMIFDKLRKSGTLVCREIVLVVDMEQVTVAAETTCIPFGNKVGTNAGQLLRLAMLDQDTSRRRAFTSSRELDEAFRFGGFEGSVILVGAIAASATSIRR